MKSNRSYIISYSITDIGIFTANVTMSKILGRSKKPLILALKQKIDDVMDIPDGCSDSIHVFGRKYNGISSILIHRVK